MQNEILVLRAEIEEKVKLIKCNTELETFRLEYLVKKGKIQGFFDRMKEVPKEQKATIGKVLNELRNFTESKYKELKEKYESDVFVVPDIDLTLPGRKNFVGSQHPVYQIMQSMVDIFAHGISLQKVR